MKAYYYRWGTQNGQTGIWERVNGQDVFKETLNPLPFARTFNPFTENVEIFGTCLYASDTVGAEGAFHSLQRNSDFSMISVRFSQNNKCFGGIQNLPKPIRLETTDSLLEENAVSSGGIRSFGVTIYYRTVQ